MTQSPNHQSPNPSSANPQITNPPITNPYVGPRTFTYAERDVFFGREREARDLLARVVSERVLLFYAQSGAGKSSLLHTRLIPQLREEEGFAVLPVGRVGGELPAGVTAVENIYLFNLMSSLDQSNVNPLRLAQLGLRHFLAHLTSDDGERWYYAPPVSTPDLEVEPTPFMEDAATLTAYDETLDAVPAELDDGNPSAQEMAPAAPATVAVGNVSHVEQRYVLIIDQFEEIITTHSHHRRERESFFRQLNQAVLADPNLWVVLTLREDYVAALDPYAHLMADKLRARFYMERMSVPAALTAIKQPAAVAGYSFAEGAAEALVDNLRRIHVFGQEETQLEDSVEPVQLQVVCYQIWDRLYGAHTGSDRQDVPATITPAILRQLAGDQDPATLIDQALGNYYESALREVLHTSASTVSERQLRDWFSTRLITDGGTRSLVNLHAEDETVAGLPQAIVTMLADQYLVRADSRAGGIWYELVHDRFIEPVLSANRAWLLRQSNPVTSAARQWLEHGRDRGYLLDGELLVQARRYATEHPQTLGELEQEFLETSETVEEKGRARRNQYIAILTSLAALVALAGLIYAFRQRMIANSALVANYSILEADRNTDTALLLALEAIKMHNSPTTRSQLHYAMARLYEPQIALLPDHTGEVWGAAYSPNGRYIATSSNDGSVILWDGETNRFVRRLQTSEANLSYYRVAFSPDSQVVAAGGFGGYLVLWDVETGAVRQIKRVDFDSIYALAFTPDGKSIITGGAQNRVRLWKVGSEEVQSLGTHDDWIWNLALSPDGTVLATASRDHTVRLWDLTQDEPISHTLELGEHETTVTSVAFHPSITKTVLASGDVRGGIFLWDLTSWREDGEPPRHSTRLQKHSTAYTIWGLAFTPDGRILASTSEASTFRYWRFDIDQDITAMDPPPLSVFLDGHTSHAADIAFSPDSQRAVVASWDGKASVWEVNSGNLVTAKAGAVSGMALLDEETLVVASPGGRIREWDLVTRALRREWQPDGTVGVQHTTLSTDGKRLLTAAIDGVVDLWDVPTGEHILRLRSPSTATIKALALSPDNMQIAVGQSDGTISHWRIRSPERLDGGPLGTQGRIDSLQFSHDSTLLASGGCNLDNIEISNAIGCPGEILLWDTKTRVRRETALSKLSDRINTGYTQLGHVSALAFSHNDQMVASGSNLGLVTIWEVESGRILSENKEHDQEPILSVLFSPDDRLLISAGPWGTADDTTGTIVLWDVERGLRFGRSLNEHDWHVNALLMNRDGTLLYSAGEEGKIYTEADGYIVVNNLDTNYLLQRACQIANRNLTRDEWRRYLGGRDYRETCRLP